VTISEHYGNLLDAEVDALVNPVNTVGVMGKGLALQFRRRFPAMFDDYRLAARRGELSVGRMHVWETVFSQPRLIVNFPTKGHWRGTSRMGDIHAGLIDLVRVIADHRIESVAIPALGCGNGGLSWVQVRPLIYCALAPWVTIDARIYPPF
jgi:O-acetyl-ADP-ribose deacetylase (regulator of RNase III)